MGEMENIIFISPDVVVKTGQSYCLAITCQGEAPGHLIWNPWDVSGQRRLWYRLDVDENAGHMLVEITRNLDPGQALTATEVDDLAGFEPSLRPTIEGGCRK